LCVRNFVYISTNQNTIIVKKTKLTKPQIKVVVKQLIHQLEGNKGLDWDLNNTELNTLLNTDCVSFKTIEDSNMTIPTGLDLDKLISFEEGSQLIARVQRYI